MPMHICPVCATGHWVHPVLHQLSYGRQTTCSPHCKQAWPAIVRQLVLAQMKENRQHETPSPGRISAPCSLTAPPTGTAPD